MHTFVQKPKTTQQTTPAKSTITTQPHVGQHRKVGSILHTGHIAKPRVQRLVESDAEADESIKTKHTPGQSSETTPNLAAHIQSLHGGQPMPASTRTFFEPRFGFDFSQVRVHTDEQARETAQALNADAFTVDQDIVFGAGRYAPETPQGKRLLGHELTHVVQQNGDAHTSHIQADPFLNSPSAAIQRYESDRASVRKRMIANKEYKLYLREISYSNPDPQFTNTVRKKWLRILNWHHVGYITDTAYITTTDMQNNTLQDFTRTLRNLIDRTWQRGDDPKFLAGKLNELDDQLKAAKKLVKTMSKPSGFTGKSWVKKFHAKRDGKINSFMDAGSWTYVHSWARWAGFGEEEVYLDL